MAYDYIIRSDREDEWLQGQAASLSLLDDTRQIAGVSYYPVHGDPILARLEDRDLLCYFIYTLSSWWEIPLIDRINYSREDNNFAIIMDINPAPETMYWLENTQRKNPENRYKDGLTAMFPQVESDSADAMYNLLRNGFGHNLFGREPGKIRFDNSFDCPPQVDEHDVLLVPPVRLAISMVNAFLAKIVRLLLFPLDEEMRIFKSYMTGSA
ncbi:MAG: hypothetical protein OXI77_01185 [Chloroflexota bacterium]|nr:hypothetical protein [Chloroflexota bacterium]MDE2908748.1 hypothetical protein [Chloroflexota bacterium]